MANRLTTGSTLGAVLLALAGAACRVHSTDVPGLTGPSELALSFRLTATPDTITHDGFSQSVIDVRAHNEHGQPLPGVSFRLDIFVGGLPAFYGTLSGRTVVTSSDGRATAVYTSPPPAPNNAIVGTCAPSVFSPQLPSICVRIVATPIGTGFTNGTQSQKVDIHLVPVITIPLPGSPAPDFSYFPAAPRVAQEIFFNASASTAAPGRTLVLYQWNWGDGTTAVGITEDHDYAVPGTYFVTLTVTDDIGATASVSKALVVSP